MGVGWMTVGWDRSWFEWWSFGVVVGWGGTWLGW